MFTTGKSNLFTKNRALQNIDSEMEALISEEKKEEHDKEIDAVIVDKGEKIEEPVSQPTQES